MQADNLLGIDLDQAIWRVVSAENLVSDISHSSLTPVRPSSWEDPYENFFEKCKFKLPTGEAVNVTAVLQRFFGQCWTNQPEETDATWRIYSPKNEGVRVRSSVGALVAAMSRAEETHGGNYFVGLVSYADQSYIDIALRHTPRTLFVKEAAREIVKTLLVKRSEFAHEKEVRILFCYADQQLMGQPLHQFSIDPNQVFEEAVFDPRMSEGRVAELLEQLRATGFTRQISQSLLYRPFSFEITLL